MKVGLVERKSARNRRFTSRKLVYTARHKIKKSENSG